MVGLGVIFNNSATVGQTVFEMNAVVGSILLVYVDGVLQNPSTYIFNTNRLIFNSPLIGGEWIHVISGQGGTFIPQSYVDNALVNKADVTTLNSGLASKMNNSGGVFTGEVSVPNPINPLNPITLQMWNGLPPIATPNLVSQSVANKADKVYVDGAINSLRTEILGQTLQMTGNRISVNNIPDVVFSDDVSFSKFGSLITGPGRGRWYPSLGGHVTTAVAYLETVSVGGNVSIDILKNGSTIFVAPDTLTIPAGSNYILFDFPYTPTFVKGDSFSIVITSVGATTPGSNLTVQIEYQYRPIGV